MKAQGKPRSRAWLWIVAVAAAIPLLIAVASQTDGSTIPVSVGGAIVHAEIAQTTAQRTRGLMFRHEMAADHGMLFVFQDDEMRSFWMKNTFLPLSIAFIDKDKRILNLHDMAPNNSDRTYPSAGPARYALEVNQGWFDQHGVHPGDVVAFTLPEAAAQ